MPSLANTSSKERQNLASRSWMRSLFPAPSSEKLMARFRACWVTKTESALPVETVTCTRRVAISLKNST
jgi:hypothetical protein